MKAVTGISGIDPSVSKEPTFPAAQLRETSDYPQASDNALNFLKVLAIEDFKYILFDDKLVTRNNKNIDVGEYKVNMEFVEYYGEQCIKVEADSHGLIEGIPCGTSLKAYITYNLETIEQHHHEYVQLENQEIDRKTHTLREENGYNVSKIVKMGTSIEEYGRKFDFGTMEGFISEGANLLLTRLLVTKPLPNYFEVISFDTDGNLCLVNYTSLGEMKQTIKSGKESEKVDVVGLERTIHSLTDLPTTWHTYMMTDGHLITRLQVGSPVTMIVKEIPELIEPDLRIPKPVFEKLDLNWEDDMELFSKYTDRKDELKAEYNLYAREHPELYAGIADYVKELLVHKPYDVVEFTANYFASLSCRDVPS